MIGAFVLGAVVGATLGGLLIAVLAAMAHSDVEALVTGKTTQDEFNEIYD